MKHVAFACMVALGAASCAMTSAGVAPKQEKLAANSAVKSAEEIIQPVRPAAAADSHLAGAKADIRRGESMLAKGEYEVARLYFERAAEKANTAIVQAKADEAEDKLERGGRS